MKKRVTLVALFALLISLVAFSQSDSTNTPYAPDRPGASYTPYLVGLHQMDYAISVGYQYYEPLDCQMHNMFYLTNQFRYGLFKHLEIRAGVDVGCYTKINGMWQGAIYGLKGVNVGFKIPIIRDVKYLPDIGIMTTAYLPNIDNSDFTLQKYVPTINLLLQKQFGKFYLIGNCGVFWDEKTGDGCYFISMNSPDTKAQGSYSLAAGVYFAETAGIFAEAYGYYSSRTSPYNFFDFGLFVNVTPEIQWDLSTGFNWNNVWGYSFINTGIAWRIPNKNK